jgi:hypothetical protein
MKERDMAVNFKQGEILVGSEKGSIVIVTEPDKLGVVQVIYSTGKIGFYKESDVKILEESHD